MESPEEYNLQLTKRASQVDRLIEHEQHQAY